jgi:tetratricopeptide (TPR) repeat protein
MTKNRLQRLLSAFMLAAMLLPALSKRVMADSSACVYAPTLEDAQRSSFSDNLAGLVRNGDQSLPTQHYPAAWSDFDLYVQYVAPFLTGEDRLALLKTLGSSPQIISDAASIPDSTKDLQDRAVPTTIDKTCMWSFAYNFLASIKSEPVFVSAPFSYNPSMDESGIKAKLKALRSDFGKSTAETDEAFSFMTSYGFIGNGNVTLTAADFKHLMAVNGIINSMRDPSKLQVTNPSLASRLGSFAKSPAKPEDFYALMKQQSSLTADAPSSDELARIVSYAIRFGYVSACQSKDAGSGYCTQSANAITSGSSTMTAHTTSSSSSELRMAEPTSSSHSTASTTATGKTNTSLASSGSGTLNATASTGIISNSASTSSSSSKLTASVPAITSSGSSSGSSGYSGQQSSSGQGLWNSAFGSSGSSASSSSLSSGSSSSGSPAAAASSGSGSNGASSSGSSGSTSGMSTSGLGSPSVNSSMLDRASAALGNATGGASSGAGTGGVLGGQGTNSMSGSLATASTMAKPSTQVVASAAAAPAYNASVPAAAAAAAAMANQSDSSASPSSSRSEAKTPSRSNAEAANAQSGDYYKPAPAAPEAAAQPQAQSQSFSAAPTIGGGDSSEDFDSFWSPAAGAQSGGQNVKTQDSAAQQPQSYAGDGFVDALASAAPAQSDTGITKTVIEQYTPPVTSQVWHSAEAAGVLAIEPSGDSTSQLAVASSVLRGDPDNIEALIKRANAYFSLQRYSLAAADAQKLIEADPAGATGHIILSKCYLAVSHPSAAMAEASRALVLDPNSTEAMLLRSMAAEQLGNYKQMLTDLHQASDIDEGAYGKKFQDALAAYGDKAPEFLIYAKEGTLRGTRGAKVAGNYTSAQKAGMALAGIAVIGLLLSFVLKRAMPKAFTISRLSSSKLPAGAVQQAVQSVAGYTVGKEIGAGNCGVVYEGKNAAGRHVAARKFDMELDGSTKAALLDRLDKIAALHHPNMTETLLVHEQDGAIWEISSYLDGKSLEDRIAEGPLALADAKKVFCGPASAMDLLHKSGFTHGTMHLADIRLDVTGEGVLTDAGIGAIVDRGDPDMSAAPEGRGTKQSDIYSFGVCMYEALTGKLPENGKVGVPSVMVKELTSEIDRIIAKATASNPDERYTSLAELSADLAKA